MKLNREVRYMIYDICTFILILTSISFFQRRSILNEVKESLKPSCFKGFVPGKFEVCDPENEPTVVLNHVKVKKGVKNDNHK